MQELDSILDADLSAKSFRTINGFCRIYPDRIEFVKSKDDTSSLLTSPFFIFRIVVLLLLAGFLFFRVFQMQQFGIDYVYILALPAAIILLSIMGNLSAFLFRLRSILFIMLFLFFVYIEYRRGNDTTVILYALIIVFLFLGFFRSFDASYVSTIPLKNIIQVKFVNSIPLLTRAYFVVIFNDENRRQRKRTILLPGILDKGESEKKIALKLMKEEGLIQ